MKKGLIAFLVILLIAGGLISAIFGSKSKPKRQAKKLYEQSVKMRDEGRKEDAAVNLNKIIADFGSSEFADEAVLNLAELKLRENELLAARDLLKMGVSLYAASNSGEEIQKSLWELNTKILFSSLVTEKDTTYEVHPGDALYKIAQKFNTTVELIQRSNNLKGSAIHPGNKLKIAAAKFTVEVDKSENILILKQDGEELKVYNVSTGENNSTPVGTFEVISKLEDPVWYKAGAIVSSESSENVLGTRWLGLSVKGYGIHGTTEPESIGRQVTAGCVRMINAEVEELYSILPVGTQVIIRD